MFDFSMSYSNQAINQQDITGKSLATNNLQCTVIWVRKSHHASLSDHKPHLAVQISTEEQFNATPRVALSGLHVYSKHNRTSHGYGGWRKVGELRRSKMSSAAIQERIADALANEFEAEARRPSPPLSPIILESAEEPQ
ncbi:hypothetical protein DHEL01_v206535 [Diaporthe helianthi]|uniref:Uncharacterized protein n=1 Tax=Diaporthe helianthi TaxID=158607 RepID=A0A2P5HXV1_DIAHE|nr:hypothetical protein DHEL01_v206535 [Diaporthe helianthi]